MRRLAVLLVVGLVVLVACDSGGGSDTSEDDGDESTQADTGDGGDDCPEDVGARQAEIGGAQATQFCGPATASITIGDETLDYADGRCDYQEDTGFFDLQIGAVIVDVDRATEVQEAEQVRYFAILAGPSPLTGEEEVEAVTGDGTYDSPLIQAGVGTELFVADDGSSVTFTNGVSAGTFEGTGSYIGGADHSFSGSFACTG